MIALLEMVICSYEVVKLRSIEPVVEAAMKGSGESEIMLAPKLRIRICNYSFNDTFIFTGSIVNSFTGFSKMTLSLSGESANSGMYEES